MSRPRQMPSVVLFKSSLLLFRENAMKKKHLKRIVYHQENCIALLTMCVNKV